MENKHVLSENIKRSNLSKDDKQLLIEILKKDDIDFNAFTLKFLAVCKASKEILKLFGIDLGDK